MPVGRIASMFTPAFASRRAALPSEPGVWARLTSVASYSLNGTFRVWKTARAAASSAVVMAARPLSPQVAPATPMMLMPLAPSASATVASAPALFSRSIRNAFMRASSSIRVARPRRLAATSRAGRETTYFTSAVEPGRPQEGRAFARS